LAYCQKGPQKKADFQEVGGDNTAVNGQFKSPTILVGGKKGGGHEDEKDYPREGREVTQEEKGEIREGGCKKPTPKKCKTTDIRLEDREENPR